MLSGFERINKVHKIIHHLLNSRLFNTAKAAYITSQWIRIYSAAECWQRNITGCLIRCEWQSQHKERCKQKHAYISDDDDGDDDDNNNNNNNNNNTMVAQRIGFWSVDWTPYSQDRIHVRDYVNDVMNRIYI